MRHRHVVLMTLMAALFSIFGCSSSGWRSSAVSVSTSAASPAELLATREQERRFAGALAFLKSGREPQARELLEAVLDGPQRSGVTDEALFRLALLSLRYESGKTGVRALEYLDRLQADFPNSIWTYQSDPLYSYLEAVRKLREGQREVRSLKEHNLSLSRDNRELRQSIEKLKSLDLELEKKIKR